MKFPQLGLSGNGLPSPKLSSEGLWRSVVVRNATKKKLVIPWLDLQQSCYYPTLSVKVNDGWHYRNINIYLQHLRAKNLYCHLLIIPDASIDSAKWSTPDILPYDWYRYEISRTDGGSQTEGTGEFASEESIFIIRVGKFLERRIKFKLLQPEAASNVCYLQTLSESKGIVVTERCILLD